MPWPIEMVPLTRAMVNDIAGDTFTDDAVKTAIIVAGRLIQQDLNFPSEFLADIVAVDFTPDPTDEATRDESFINLCTVRAACIIDRGAATKAAGQAILIRDGSSTIDLRDMFKAKLQLINKGWCAVYDDMRLNYQTSQRGVVIGAAIVSPFRLFAGMDAPYLQINRRW